MHHPRLIRSLLPALAFAALLGLAGNADAAPRPSIEVSDPAINAVDSDHVTGRLGMVTAGWITRRDGETVGVQIRQLPADGSSSAITDIPGVGAHPRGLDLELNYDDVVTAVWNSDEGIRMSRIAADGTPGPVVDLGPASSDATPEAITDFRDHTTIAWQGSGRQGRRLVTVLVGSDGAVGPMRLLSSKAAQSPALGVMGNSSQLAATWVTDPSRGSKPTVQMRTVFTSGKLGPVRSLSRQGFKASAPSLAVNSDDAIAIAWTSRSGSEVQGVSIPDGRDTGPTMRLDNDNGRHADDDPEVAFSRFGNAVVTWESIGGNGSTLVAAELEGDGRASPAETLAREGGSPEISHLQGGAVLIAYEYPGGIRTATYLDGTKVAGSQVVVGLPGATDLVLDAVGKAGSLTWSAPAGQRPLLHGVVRLTRIPPP